MSKHPEAKALTKKAWSTPKLRKITPYGEVIEILKAALQQVEKSLSQNSNDPKEVEIQRSLKRMLNDLQSESNSNAA